MEIWMGIRFAARAKRGILHGRATGLSIQVDARLPWSVFYEVRWSPPSRLIRITMSTCLAGP